MKKIFCKLIMFSVFILSLCTFFSACSFGGSTKSNSGKITLTEEMIHNINLSSQRYTGEELTVDTSRMYALLESSVVPASEFDFEITDNINVGEATITVTAKESCEKVSGSVVLHFQILPNNTTTVSTYDDLKDLIDSKNYSPEIDADIIIPEDAELEIGEGIDLEIIKDVKVINNGTIKLNGSISVGGRTNYSPKFINSGNIENNGKLWIGYGGRFYNAGDFSDEITVKNYGVIYTNGENSKLSNIDAGSSGREIERELVTTEKLEFRSLENDTIYYEKGKTLYTPYVTLNGQGFYSEEFEYVNNTAPGIATINVTANDDNQYFYGSASKNFTIAKGTIRYTSISDFNSNFETDKASKLYSTYICQAGMTISKSFTIDEDETFSGSGGAYTLVLSGNITNNGTISIPSSKGSLELRGNIVNNGTISSLGSIYSQAEINNNENAQISAETFEVQVNGNVVNSGNLTANKYIYIHSGFENKRSGQISSTLASHFYSSFNNAGSVVVNSSAIFDSSFLNSGSIIVTGLATFNDMNIVNTGNVSFGDDVVLNYDAEPIFSNSGTITIAENFNCYAFDNVESVAVGIPENTIYRKLLGNATVTLEYDEVTYDGQNHEPIVFINDAQISSTDYRITYTYYVSSYSNTNHVGAGTVIVEVRNKNYKNNFIGTNQTQYVINRAENYYLDSSNDLIKALTSDRNYKNIVMTNDITISNNASNSEANRTLSEFQKLYTNGHKLILTDGGYLIVDGTLVVDEIDNSNVSLENAGLQLSMSQTTTSIYYTPRINVRGTIENHGIIYAEPKRTQITFSAVAQLKNSGKVFINSSTGYATVTGTENVFIRQDIGTIDLSCITLEYSSINYNKLAHQPNITNFTFNGSSLDLSKFDVTYGNNINAGQNTAEVHISPNSNFDEHFYGSVIKYFTINRIQRDIDGSNASTLSTEFFDSTNYYRFNLQQNVTLSNSIELSGDIIFDFGNYRINANSKKITVGEDVQLWMNISTISDFTKYKYIVDKFTLNSNIGTAGDSKIIYALVPKTSYQLHTKDEGEGANYIGEHINKLEIDMNGHRFLQALDFSNQLTMTLDIYIHSNSKANSSIGSTSTTTYALYQSLPSGTTEYTSNVNITLNTVTVYGMYLAGGQNGNVSIDAENCDFIYAKSGSAYNSSAALNMKENLSHTETYFKDCSFTSSYTAVKIIGQTHTFEDCTFQVTGEYYRESRSSGAGYGSCVIVFAYSSNVTFLRHCVFTSAGGYGIEAYYQYGAGHVINISTQSDFTACNRGRYNRLPAAN